MAGPIFDKYGRFRNIATKHQLTLHFDTREEAVAYCEREGIPYQVFEPKEPARRQMAYSDNFAFRRGEPWTH